MKIKYYPVVDILIGVAFMCVFLSVIVLIVSLVGCSEDSEKVSDKGKVTSSIIVVEEFTKGQDTYSVLRDEKTGHEYLYIDGYKSGCIIELRKEQTP